MGGSSADYIVAIVLRSLPAIDAITVPPQLSRFHSTGQNQNVQVLSYSHTMSLSYRPTAFQHIVVGLGEARRLRQLQCVAGSTWRPATEQCMSDERRETASRDASAACRRRIERRTFSRILPTFSIHDYASGGRIVCLQ